eukprot:scaffold8383_cov277-Pinguiococcus_pyrenoidosus.AAC.3
MLDIAVCQDSSVSAAGNESCASAVTKIHLHLPVEPRLSSRDPSSTSLEKYGRSISTWSAVL